MKKWVIFIFGVIVGAIIATSIAFIITYNEPKTSDSDELEVLEDSLEPDPSYQSPYLIEQNRDDLFRTKGELVNEKSFKVLQAYQYLGALVYGKDEYGYYSGMLYYLDISGTDMTLYDDKIIKVSKGQEVRLLGVHKYTTREGVYKTVPVIRIVYK